MQKDCGKGLHVQRAEQPFLGTGLGYGRIVAKDYWGDRDFKQIIRVIAHQLGAEKLILKAVKNKKK